MPKPESGVNTAMNTTRHGKPFDRTVGLDKNSPMPLIAPDPHDERLSAPVSGVNERGENIDLRVVTERPLTLYLNSQEVVTMMTIGDHPNLLALGYLINQNMLSGMDDVTGVEFDDELGVVVVRTASQTTFEDKMKRRVRTSGCAQGTVFGDVIDAFDDVQLDAGA
ncbi:MAG: formate dehydrogenase accessory sulfurtransferase FdhD, partial [Pseudomonadota bacterium]